MSHFKTLRDLNGAFEYRQKCNAELECMTNAYERIGGLMPRPYELVRVKMRGFWYLGLVVEHVVGKVIGSYFGKQGESHYGSWGDSLCTLEDFHNKAIENDMTQVVDLLDRAMTLISDAMDKGVSIRDNHPWNFMYDSKRDKVVYIDFSPSHVDFECQTLDETLDAVFG